jgi:transcriptional regulator with GAF, ATPase, and Fis domain
MTINEQDLQTSYHFIEVASQHEQISPMLHGLVAEIKDLVGCSATGIYLFDEKNNILYQACDGFSQNFCEPETPFSVYLDKFKSDVINRVTDLSLPFYSTGGSFYLNSTNHLPSTVTEKEKGHIRSLCHGLGYKSLAMIPIRGHNGGILGLIHLADKKENGAPLEKVELLEKTTMLLSFAIERILMEEKLKNAFLEIEHLNDQLQADNIYLHDEVYSEFGFDKIIGQSDAIKYVFFKVKQVASTDTTVLLLGETGTGKELIARAIHELSSRKNRPLVKVNCATLPSNLIESELFGHEKGAFTGADYKQLGRFEIANGSTIFLDEIGELPLELQAKIMRVIQDGEFERLGNHHTHTTDVRIIAATNRNLEEEVQNKQFREDLYYRLKVFPISIPPLRKRIEDIPLLVKAFTTKFTKRQRKSIKEISQYDLEKLQKHSWPGNVRELESMIERAVVNSQGSVLHIIDMIESNPDSGLSPNQRRSLADVERDYIIHILEETNWRIEGKNGAAVVLDLNPGTLRGRMRKLGIHRPTQKNRTIKIN